jgi:hypothetical protein
VIALPGRPRPIGTDVAHPYVLGTQSQQHGHHWCCWDCPVQCCRDTDTIALTKWNVFCSAHRNRCKVNITQHVTVMTQVSQTS